MSNPFIINRDKNDLLKPLSNNRTESSSINNNVELINITTTSLPTINEINHGSDSHSSQKYINPYLHQPIPSIPSIQPIERSNSNINITNSNRQFNPLYNTNTHINTSQTNQNTVSNYYITSPSLITNQIPISILNNQSESIKTNIYVVDSLNKFDINQTMTNCPYCKGSNIITDIHKKVSIANLSLCCIFGPLVYIAFQMIRQKRLSCMDVTHSCPLCKSEIYKYYSC